MKVLDSRDEYGLLDVTADATPEEVRQGYVRVTERIRPNCFSELTPTVRKNALAVHEAMKSAFNTILLRHFSPIPDTEQGLPADTLRLEKAKVLKNQSGLGQPKSTDQGAAEGTPRAGLEAANTPASPSVFPTVLFEEAKRLVSENRWAEAQDQIRAALSQSPQDLDFLAMDAWIRFNLPAEDSALKLRRCASTLHHVVCQNPRNLDAYYYLGRVFESARRYGEAMTCYYAIQDTDPKADYPQLAKRVRLLQVRKIQPKPIPSFDEDSSGLDFDNSQLKMRTVKKQA